MRFYFYVLLIVFLLVSTADAQTEIVRQKFEQGLAKARENRFEQALADFENALEKYKFASDFDERFAAKINYNIGVCLYRTERAAESVRYLEAAVKLARNKYPQAFHALGAAQSELGNFEQAKRALESAVRLDRNNGEHWFDLALAYLSENDLTRAADGFRKAIFYRSGDAATAHNNLGVIAAFSGDWVRAEKEFETALEMSGGKLVEAKRNLRICRTQNFSRAFAAKLEFAHSKFKEKI